MAKRILVVDDDELNLKLVKARLEGQKYEVVTVNDGADGLSLLKKEKFDLVILDVQMPKMNGYTFMIEFKKLGDLSYVPVIVLTAHEEMQPIFTLKGVRGYLVKPLNFDLLLQKMTALIGPAGS